MSNKGKKAIDNTSITKKSQDNKGKYKKSQLNLTFDNYKDKGKEKEVITIESKKKE